MKLRELKKEVYSLSFIPEEEEGVRFISAVRRALSIIFCELKVTGRRTVLIGKDIFHSITGLHHIGGKTVTLPLAGRAYALRLSGKGSFTVHDGAVEITKSFDSDDITFKGFLEQGGTVEFGGPYSYTIHSLVIYSEIPSDRIDDIPEPEDSPVIDMSDYPDFFSFSTPPTDASGNDIRGAFTDGTKLVLPKGFSGKVNIFYRKRPIHLSDNDEQLVDIPDAYLPLLAPLSAALMLLDDDKDLSECYMELYSRMAEDIKKNATSANTKYVRTNGWA